MIIVKKYGAPWCAKCVCLKPEFDKLSKEVSYKAVSFQEVDCDTDLGLADANAKGLKSLPAVIIERDGEERFRAVAHVDLKEVRTALDGLLECAEG